jgi:predicted dehydrogenase
MALLLAERGIPALIEKPIAASMPEGKKIIDAFSSASLTGSVGHIERFNPAVQGLKAQLENGLLGEVFQITTRRTGPFTGRIADVGVVKDLASHDIDLVSWIVGSKYASVDARITHRSGRSHEDLLIAVATLDNGVVVNHMVNWLSPYKERVTTVLGEKGLLVADTLNTKLTYIENGLLHKDWDETGSFKGVSEGEGREFELRTIEPLKLEHLSFQSDIKAGKVIDSVSLAEGLEVLRVAELMVARAQSLGGNA